MLVVVGAGCGKEASFQVRESVEQLHITHAAPGTELSLVNSAGKELAFGTADDQGSLVLRRLPPGQGYQVKTRGMQPEVSRPLKVMSVEESKPRPEDYAKQELKAGFNYLTMRDGTTLSAWVTLPRGKGPFPTVVNYSGYDASRPQDPNPDLTFLCDDFPVMCTPPTDPNSLLAGMLGYATVSVNMRGTGCSGGAYDYFETLQVLDGYDVIEIVAAQSWTLHHQVGMVGLSYPGITQLFVAAQRPPGLAAISPMSVIGSTDTTLLPGGILNDGFAISWVKNVLSKAVPYGQGWEQKRVDAGDTICAENQLLHSQLIDNVAQARQIIYYDPNEHDRFNPSTFVDKIEVPVFLTGSWQDEQTGPYFFLLFDKFKNSESVRLTATNGVHIDGFGPHILTEWHTFLELFVAKRKPLDPMKVRNVSPLLYTSFFNAPLVLPPSRFVNYQSYEEALAAWKAEAPLRVMFESGAVGPELGTPVPAFEHSFTSYPPPETNALTFYFQPQGQLGSAAPMVANAGSTFRLDPEAGKTGVLAPNGDIWARLPAYDWKQPMSGGAVVLESEPIAQDLVLLGTASVDLWLKSPVDDADLEVTLSEVRADGKEIYIQSGWLRAGHRKPGPNATPLWPAQTLMLDAWAPLPLNEWTEVRVGTAGFAHAARSGSRLRVSIDTPGGVRADWRFALKKFDGDVTYAIGHDSAHPSKVVLPRLDGVRVPSMAPVCPSLRGQPCRDRMNITNTAMP
ncbi:MAG: CocE/NonD family hydrolase [Archangium sp.]|nr:CocE/NonD family hydrolase [Archangium sp.]